MNIWTKRRAGVTKQTHKTFKSNSFVVFWQKWYYIYWTMIEKWGRARLSRVWNVESSAQHHQSVISQSAVGADEGNNRIMQCWLELQTKIPEDYAKISQSRRRPLLGSWLKALTSTFIFKTLWRHYAKTSCNLSEALFEALVVAHVSTEISNFTSIYLNISKWV